MIINLKNYILFFVILFPAYLNAAPASKHPMDIYALNLKNPFKVGFMI